MAARERGILFTGPMVLAILAGRKSKTRRVLAPLKSDETSNNPYVMWPVYERGRRVGSSANPDRAAPYAPGDILYVREAWRVASLYDHLPPRDLPELRLGAGLFYEADAGYKPQSRYRHARFMPRWASRITLLVTDVRVERLQDISEADAIAEGCALYVPGHGFITRAELEADPGYSNFLAPRMGFEAIWSEIHGPDAWERNPWVAAITFERLS